MKFVRKISDGFGLASGVLMIAIWVLMTVEVVARNIFHSPILGASEIGIYLYVSAAYLGFSYTQKYKGHISVELLYDRLGPKAKKINDLIVCVISVVLFAFFNICMWDAFIESFKIKEIYLSAMKMPVYLLRFMISIGLAAMLIQVVIDLFDAVKAVINMNKMSDGSMEVQE